MKTLLAAIFLFLIAFQSYAQFDENKALYMLKVEKYRRMKSTGMALTLVGTGVAIAGLVTVANSSYTTTTNSYGQTTTQSSGNGAGGAVAWLVGNLAVGVGVPFWIIGGINKGRYERKLQQLSVRLNATPHSTGVTLRLKL